MHEKGESTIVWGENTNPTTKRDSLLQYIQYETLVQTLLQMVADQNHTTVTNVLNAVAAVPDITSLVDNVSHIIVNQYKLIETYVHF